MTTNDKPRVPLVSARGKARYKLAERMVDVVGCAPMAFIADPQVPLLTAELLLRDLEELGWTPPKEDQ